MAGRGCVYLPHKEGIEYILNQSTVAAVIFSLAVAIPAKGYWKG
jgi:hypothetical protein